MCRDRARRPRPDFVREVLRRPHPAVLRGRLGRLRSRAAHLGARPRRAGRAAPGHRGPARPRLGRRRRPRGAGRQRAAACSARSWDARGARDERPEIRLLHEMPELHRGGPAVRRQVVAPTRRPAPGGAPELMRAWAHSGCYVSRRLRRRRDGGRERRVLRRTPATRVSLPLPHHRRAAAGARAAASGYALKLHQYAWALEPASTRSSGPSTRWSRRNAYFNLARLGADARRRTCPTSTAT